MELMAARGLVNLGVPKRQIHGRCGWCRVQKHVFCRCGVLLRRLDTDDVADDGGASFVSFVAS